MTTLAGFRRLIGGMALTAAAALPAAAQQWEDARPEISTPAPADVRTSTGTATSGGLPEPTLPSDAGSPAGARP